MITIEFIQFLAFLMFGTAVLRIITAKLAHTRAGSALAFVTP